MNNFNQPLILKPKTPEAEPRVRKKFSKKKLFLSILFLAIVICGVWFIKLYSKNQNTITAQEVIKMIETQMVLPTDEEPSISTIVNLDEVRYQPFFINAQEGDQFIVYSKAKKAILYRPSIKKIIEVASLR